MDRIVDAAGGMATRRGARAFNTAVRYSRNIASSRGYTTDRVRALDSSSDEFQRLISTPASRATYMRGALGSGR